MDYRNQLETIYKQMTNESNRIHKVLNSFPDGTIQIDKRNDYIRYNIVTYENHKRIRKGITSNKKCVSQFARKAYLSEYCKRIDANINLVKSILDSYWDTDYATLAKELPKNFTSIPQELIGTWVPNQMNPTYDKSIPIQMAQLIIPENEIALWPSKPYRANSYNIENKIHKSLSGHLFRSKSELSLFELYTKLNVSTHYDEVLSFNGKYMSPDFISLRTDGMLIYHEHCGLVNNPSYIEEHNKKMAYYASYGIYPWMNLIITYDTPNGALDLQLAEAEIKSKLLL